MANIYRSAAELIGNTPLLELGNIARKDSLKVRLLAKLESHNPAGSAKDRVALNMLDAAERCGQLAPGSTIIEPTSGNTGIGLCAVAAARGYKCIIVMPDSMSAERQMLMRAYGAEVVLTPGKQGMAGAVERAKELAAQIPGSWIPGQFDNPANALAHYRTTGPEIWEQTKGMVDIFVAGVGTGGTVTGVGRFLKEQNPAIRIVAVEPASSPLLSQGRAGGHRIQGIGANFVPGVLDRKLLDEVVTVTDEEALTATRALAREQGILAGISSGAAYCAARKIADSQPDKRVVTLLPDSGMRYLSMGLFE